jgi:lipopolysaccharide/colanic/teichoic acid biosynthesis glycosyltransferase
MNRLIAALLLLITFPVILIIAILIKSKYPGSFFYQQVREGKNGKPFKIIKLRTMVANAEMVLQNMLKDNPELVEKWAATGVIKNDPRIAGKLGRLSRELSIDELPQLINVLKGEMTLIGPRPLEIPSVEMLHPNTRSLRNSILPGITGLAQVENRSATIRQMQFYDRLYIKNRTIGLNIYIVYKTLHSIIKRTGA